MTERAASEASVAVRAVVVYRYPVYRDLITRVLEKADVRVAAAIDVKELNRATLRSLRPDVVVIYDPDANNLLRDVAASALTDAAGTDVRRVVCVGSDNEMVVLSRLVLPNPSVEGLVGFVKGQLGDVTAPSDLDAEATCQTVERQEQMTGCGGS